MKKAEEIFNLLKEKFGDSVSELKSDLPVEPIIIVSPLSIDQVATYLKNYEELQFDSLMNLSGVDDFNGEKVDDGTGKQVMKNGNLSVYYHLESTKLKHKIVLKVSTNRDNPEVSSVVEVWNCANWHEREAFDMFGIKFLNHPDLRRILMPYDWEAGFPLRKDYENPEFYQGMKVPY